MHHDAESLERHLLQRGVGALEAHRSRCADCGRTPLIGEYVHLYEQRSSRPPAVVCELCRAHRSQPPAVTETVRHSERGHAVRLMARAA